MYINTDKYPFNIPTVAVIFKFSLIQLHCQVWGLKVESHHLTAGVPEYLRHVVTGVDTTTLRVDTTHLSLVVTQLS